MFTALSSQPPSIIMAPEIPDDPMEFLSRSWSAAATEVSKALVPATAAVSIPDAPAAEPDDDPPIAGNPFSFASSATSQLVLERIMSQSHEVSPLTSGRLSHSSGPLTGDGSFTDSPPVSLSDLDDAKLCQLGNTPRAHYRSRTVGRWLKDRKERKKEESRAHNAHLHAAVSVAGVAAAVAAIASAAAATKRGRAAARTDAAVASAATLVAAQCVEAAEALGAEREHLASVVSSAVSVRTPGDIVTLTAAAATALRGAATLKARILKEASNMAAVAPVEKNCTDNNRHTPKETNHIPSNEDTEKLLGILARGTELLKRTRKGALHWKVASVYIHRTGQVMLKTKSRHVAGTFTKKKKNVVTGVSNDTAAWPGRYLLDGAEQRRYFGLRTVEGRVIEFECRSQREYEMFTQGVSRLLDIVAGGEKHV